MLLFAFSAVVLANLARGKRPGCHCFGQAHSTPIGASTLIRNGVLSVMSAVIFWQGPGSPVSDAAARFADVSPAAIAGVAGALLLLCVLILQGWLIMNLTRQQGRILLRLDSIEAPLNNPQGLPVGASAPEFSLSTINGEMLTLARLVSVGRPAIFIFTSPDCGPCNALLSEIGRWQHHHQKTLTLALVARGNPAANRARAEKHRLRTVFLEKDREVAEAHDALPTPSAVAIGSDSRIMSPVAVGSEAIRSLIRIVDAKASQTQTTAMSQNGKSEEEIEIPTPSNETTDPREDRPTARASRVGIIIRVPG